MKTENKYGREIPTSYLSFLNDNPNGCFLNFRVDSQYESETKMFGETELLENIEMNSIGNALQYDCLKLYIKFQRVFGYADIDKPNLNEEEMKQIEKGFVIGYGDISDGYGFLYLDFSDNSVWIYYSNDGHVKKIANSFEVFISEVNIMM